MTAPFFLLRNSRTLIVVWALTALVALAALVGATDGRPVSMSGASAPAATSGSVEPGLAALAQRHPAQSTEVIVQLRTAAAAAQVRASIAAAHGSVLRELSIINGIAARMPAGAAVRLASIEGVRAVSPNAGIASSGTVDTSAIASAYNQSIRADKVWSSGITGQGVGVAVVDTGIDGSLPDFRVSAANAASRVKAVGVVNPAATNGTDTYGHGTHVAGLIAGNGLNRPAGDPLAGRYVGVAPDANLIAVKADDGHGHASVLDLLDSLQFVIDHRAALNIRVVNLSVRATAAESYKTSPLDAAVERLWFKGVVVVAAAGNLGTAADAVSYPPANDPYVISVGGVDDMGTKATADDTIASWSSRGTTQDGFAKPDVLAPGAHLVSTLAGNADYASLCASCVTDGSYIRLGGTSMAAGIVSGAVADVLSAYPSWTPDQVKASLMKRTRPVRRSQNTTDTFVDADGTVEPQGVDDTTTIYQGEIALDKVIAIGNGSPAASTNAGLTPNNFVDAATGDITDQTGSWGTGSWGTGSWGTGSWGGGLWATASGDLAPAWASVSYVGAPLDPNGFQVVLADCMQVDRGHFSTGSWATGSWSSEQLGAALADCTQASSQTGSWGTGSWGTGSWGTGSWGTGSWGTGSWGTGSWATSYDR